MLKRIGSLAVTAVLATGFYLSVALGEAHAYIDVASNGYILQMLLGALFGGLFMVKVFWQRITAIVSKFFSRLRGIRTSPR